MRLPCNGATTRVERETRCREIRPFRLCQCLTRHRDPWWLVVSTHPGIRGQRGFQREVITKGRTVLAVRDPVGQHQGNWKKKPPQVLSTDGIRITAGCLFQCSLHQIIKSLPKVFPTPTRRWSHESVRLMAGENSDRDRTHVSSMSSCSGS